MSEHSEQVSFTLTVIDIENNVAMQILYILKQLASQLFRCQTSLVGNCYLGMTADRINIRQGIKNTLAAIHFTNFLSQFYTENDVV
jgi:hypothetical protein